MPNRTLCLLIPLLLPAQAGMGQTVSRTVFLEAAVATGPTDQERWSLTFRAEGGQSSLWMTFPQNPKPSDTLVITLTADRATELGPLTWALLQAGGVGPVGAEVGSEDSLKWPATFEGRGLSWTADPAPAAPPYSREPPGTWEVYSVSVVPEGDPIGEPVPLIVGLDRDGGRAALFQPRMTGVPGAAKMGPVILAFTLASLWRHRE